MAKDLARLQQLLTNVNLGAYSTISNPTTLGNNVEITANNYDAITSLDMTGPEDTLKYVDHVKKFLEVLRSKDTSYNKYYDLNTTVIQSMDNLINLTKDLAKNDFLSGLDTSAESTYQLSNAEYNKSVLFPYFYSMYLYEPKLLEGETINSSFAKNKWYAPSVGELARAMYCRGMSVSNLFSTADITSAINLKATSEYAIFAKAMDRMKSDFPTVWSDLMAVGNNIITNVYTSGTDNYGYSIYSSGNTAPQGQWTYGEAPYDVTGNYNSW
jgi:hypothetical protein